MNKQYKIRKMILLVVLVISIFSCSKDNDFVSKIEQINKDNATTNIPTYNKEYPLYKESYLNQRSGIVFWWHDNINPAWPYISNVDFFISAPNTSQQWFGSHAYYDINNDGYQDILTVYHFSPSPNIQPEPELVWLINKGDNLNFTKSTIYFNQNTKNITAHKILKTDVNNDNIVDFILLGVIENPGSYGGTFTVLIGKSNGTYDINNIPNPNSYWFHNGACGDLNGDGFVDVITATFIWWGDGKGNFTKTFNQHKTDMAGYYNWTTSPLVYEILDINKDGWNDLILRGPQKPTTIVLNNKGKFDETNQTITLPSVEFKNVLDIEIIDFDKDGDLDILELAQLGGEPDGIIQFDAKYSVSKIIVYYNNNLSFKADENILSESLDGNWMYGDMDKYGWSTFKFDDIDGDGIDEILSESYQDGTYNALKKVGEAWKKITITFRK